MMHSIYRDDALVAIIVGTREDAEAFIGRECTWFPGSVWKIRECRYVDFHDVD